MIYILTSYVSIGCVLGPMFALSPCLDWSFINYEGKSMGWFKKLVASIAAGIVWPFLIRNMWK